MKRILSVLLILTLMVVCFNYVEGPLLEERVLDEQILNFVVHDPEQVMFGKGLAGITNRKTFHFSWPVSHGKRRWGYSFWYDNKSEDGIVLMDQFRTQVLDALQQSDAVILRKEDAESSSAPVGFKIEYEKSKVSGEISVSYGTWAEGLHLFEVTQSEVQ